MRNKSYIGFVIFWATFLLGQEEGIDYKNVTVKPVFPGCENLEEKVLDHCNSKVVQTELMRYLTYPEEAIEEGRIGTAYIKFIVSEKGEIENTKIFRSSKHKDLDKASVKAVSLLFHAKKVIPGKLNDDPVKVSYEVPVRFRLEENLDSKKLTTDAILDRLEKMKSSTFKDTSVKVFSDNYIKFVKGIIVGFYLKDRQAVQDWETFFKEKRLNEMPDEAKLTIQDKVNLKKLLSEINDIKESIH
ncbi:MAG: energy transducer TonB [Flavobacteriales bacterium]